MSPVRVRARVGAKRSLASSRGFGASEAALPGYELGDLILNGRALTTNFDQAVVSASVERSIEAASTLTLAVHDPRRVLLAAGVLDVASDLTVGGVHRFRLVQVAKSGDTFSMTFEDRDVARLRLAKKPRKASRGKVTRAEFAKSLVDETPGVRFFCPDLHRVQPFTRADADSVRKAPASAAKRSGSSSARASGFAPGVRLRGKEGTLGADQLRNAAAALTEAARLDAPPKATLALVMACIIEAPDFKNPTGGHDSSVGILQLLNIHLGGSVAARRDIPRVVNLFLTKGFTGKGGAIAIAKANPSMTAGQVAQAVQGSAHPGRYDAVGSQARAIVEAFGGGGAAGREDAGGSEPGTYGRRYEFSRGTTDGEEDTWTALGRLAEEVRRRRFLIDREVVFAFDRDLMKQAPRMTISEDSRGVDWIDFEWDTGKKVETCTVVCRADMWLARPGDVAVVEDSGPADDRWLIAKISGDLFSISRSVELVRATQPKGEPRSEKVTRANDASADGSLSGGQGDDDVSASGLRNKILKIARASMTSRSGFKRYSQAGATTTDPTPPVPNRTDCSQWIRACYLRAGGPDPGLNTFEMARKGKRTKRPKPGDIMLTANVGHCEIYIGDGKTIGHGSPPIDGGTVSSFPGHFFVTYSELGD